MSEEKITTDRYQALRINCPNPETMCKGSCEGTGLVPISKDKTDEPWKSLWLEAEKNEPTDDGWHFVTCPECGGTGKENNPKPLSDKERLELFEKQVESLKDLVKLQCSKGNYDYDEYMLGMANGMILALATVGDVTPEFLDKPDVWGKDQPIGEIVAVGEDEEG